MGVLSTVRNRYHPLFYLRRFTLFQRMTRWLDIPVSVRCPDVDHLVYVSLSKNLSFVVSNGALDEEQERENFGKLLTMGNWRRFFDIGANVGLYGFIFRTRVSDAMVTMFEPDPDNARLIRRTVARAALRGVEVVECAVSDREGQVTFYKDELTGASGSITRGRDKDAFVSIHHGYTPREVTVKATTIDDIVPRFGEPDLIKLDVEGAELAILQGGDAFIRRGQPALFFECDQNQEDVRLFLSERGYVFFDFVTMQRTRELTHNNLALHVNRHADLLTRIEAMHLSGCN